MHPLRSTTTNHFVGIDTFVNANDANYSSAAIKALKASHELHSWSHVQALKTQGSSLTVMLQCLSKDTIRNWSSHLTSLPGPLFKFARKALQQQLPTAANLNRWGKSTSPLCPLCTAVQTNKHVLSNCSAPIALNRYSLHCDITKF